MVRIGDGLIAVGRPVEASREYQKLLDRAGRRSGIRRGRPKGDRPRTHQLAGLLRGRFDAAMQQVEKLMETNPRALEPLMEKGRILNEWAEREPAQFEKAVAHWALLRSRLQSLPAEPPEYFDVTYNVAACLVREAETTRDRAVAADRAQKAEQVLKSVLILSPKLNGPDAVARYRVLLDKAIALQGRPAEK